MRLVTRRSAWFRKGVAAVMFGLLLPVFIGFASLAVDTSMIAVARGQLSTAADSAALAGAQQLATEGRVRGATTLTAEITASNNQALAFAQDNTALGAIPVISTNVANDSSGQIVVGYLDPRDPSSTLDTSPSKNNLFNSVQVTLYRDAAHGGPVPTIFGQLMGYHGSNVTVRSTATAQAYSVRGFRATGSLKAQLLPIVLDNLTWQAMMAGRLTGGTTDQYTYDESTNTVTPGPDGIFESQAPLYPVGSGFPGNWGTINVGVSNNSTSTLGSQIRNGIPPDQMVTSTGAPIVLDTTLTPQSCTFSGNPGISAGIKDDLTAIIGQPRFVPIYDQGGGNGNNAWYHVIAFQPARILSVNFQGNPKYVIIQPCLINDPTAIMGTAVSYTQGGAFCPYLSR